MIEHEASGASGSAERSTSGVGRSPRRPRRHSRTFTVGCLAVLVLLGGVFWRPIAILWCWTVARESADTPVVAWNCAALSALGPSSLPALARLVERPELQRAWSAGEGLALLHASAPEANAPVHDLLLSPSERVRCVTGMILLASDDHDASGLGALVEGLSSHDPDVRLFSALALARCPGARFEKLVPDPPRVFQSMAQALSEGLTDPRGLFVHAQTHGVHVAGEWRIVADLARESLTRLDPAFASKVALGRALVDEPRATYEAARERKGDFWK